MLINAQSAEQVRVAVVEGNELKDYQFEITDKDLCRGNIYRGVVANVQSSLGAAFIDIGEDRHGFLPVGDVVPEAYHKKPPKGVKRPKVEQVLERGKTVLVQVTKDAVGLKGSALTTNVALAGRYLVLTPFDSVRGISRKAEDDKSRKTIKGRLAKLNLPDGHGVIVRTNGLEQNQTTLNRDLGALLRLWKRVRDETAKGKGPRLLYTDQDLIVQALRDFLDSSIGQVIVDDDDVYAKAETYMRAFMPRSKTQLIRYNERLPLFTKYRLEEQIDGIYERKTLLPSGGSIVIDGTEALTAIDVNSGRSGKGSGHDESILKVNIEAAKEVARQLRLRDIGGLVVVDFIDMRTRKHQSKLEKTMRDAMKIDKARYSVGRISPNGLLEINRQRIKQALHQRTHRPCPLCHGGGTIPSPEFAAATLLGKVEARVANGMIEKATVAAHPEIADALQNGHRARLAALEQELELTIEVISATNFRRTEERIDYTSREKAVTPPKPAAALSSSDLAESAGPARGAKPKVAPDAAKETEAAAATEAEADAPSVAEEQKAGPKRAPRKRRRRRKSPAQVQKEKEAAAAADAESADEPAEAAEASGNGGKPSRTRRRRRGGRRARRSAKDRSGKDSAAEQQAADGKPAEDKASDAESTAKGRRGRRPRRWARDDADSSASPAPSPERRRPSRRRAARGSADDAPAGGVPAERVPGTRGWQPVAADEPPPAADREGKVDLFDFHPPSAAASTDKKDSGPSRDAKADDLPLGADVWRSPLSESQDGPEEAAPRRTPLRRDRSKTLRWQWWGGADDAESAAESSGGAKDSDDA